MRRHGCKLVMLSLGALGAPTQPLEMTRSILQHIEEADYAYHKCAVALALERSQDDS